MTYLDEISTRTEPTVDNVREEMKYKSQGWVPHSDVPGSLEDAFRLWDAVSFALQPDRKRNRVSYKKTRYITE